MTGWIPHSQGERWSLTAVGDMTLHTKLHTSPINSEALPCTLMHCIPDSTDCATLYHLLYPCPCTCCFLVCLFVCLSFVHWHHMSLACLFVFPFGLLPLLTGSGPMLKSDCTCCIRRGLGRRLSVRVHPRLGVY